MTTVKIITAALAGVLFMSGCSTKRPLLPQMNPVKLETQSINNMSKEEVQILLSKKMNEKIAEAGGSAYLTDPKHLAISILGTRKGLTPGDLYTYRYIYGYMYEPTKNEIVEIPESICIWKWNADRSGKEHLDEEDCNNMLNPSYLFYRPSDDFKKKVLDFRAYLSSEFPSYIADYNSKKSK
jgi:hypothetical protein